MAYTIDSLNLTGGPQSGSTTRTENVSVANNGSLVIVAISSATSSDNHGTPTLGGVAMTQIESKISGNQRAGTLWYKANVSAGTHTLSMSPSSISNRYSWGWAVIAGVATSSPLDTSTIGSTTTGTSRTGTLTLGVANALTLLFNFNLYNASTNSTKTFGTEDDHNLFHNTDDKASGSFSMTASYTSSQENSFIMVSFKPNAQTYNQAVTATAVATVSISDIASFLKSLTVTALAGVSIIKQAQKTITTTAQATVSQIKQLYKELGVTAIGEAIIQASRVFLQALTATASAVASITKQEVTLVTLEVTAAATATVSMIKSFIRTIVATASATASIVTGYTLSKVLEVTASATVSITKGLVLSMELIVTAVGVATTAVQKALSMTISVVAKGIATLVRDFGYTDKYPRNEVDYEDKYPTNSEY